MTVHIRRAIRRETMGRETEFAVQTHTGDGLWTTAVVYTGNFLAGARSMAYVDGMLHGLTGHATAKLDVDVEVE